MVDAEERIERVLPKLDGLIRDVGVLITMERVRVIRYVHRP